MKKTTRAQKAKETLDIIETGRYSAGGRIIDLEADLERSLTGSVLYKPEDFEAILRATDEQLKSLCLTTNIRVENCTVLKAAEVMHQRGGKTGCLNFASAKNPGGGFLNGALAQEESLAVSSTLYATQMRQFGLYEYNRSQRTYLYSDHMIYSPDVTVFRNDDGELLPHPYPLSIITSPATNIGAIRVNKPAEMEQVEETMLRRMDRMLAVFVHHGIRRILLGAWGCGVFQNDPANIAAWFAHYLTNGGKYSACFEEVFFAVYDRVKDGENMRAFKEKMMAGM